MNDGLSLSAAGLSFIARHEGFRARAYSDAAGYETIGYGHRVTAGERYPHGIGEEAARRLLAADAGQAEEAVRAGVGVALIQAEFDALISFTFNVGAGAFARSTLRQRLNAGDFTGAADEFLRWNKLRVNGALCVSPGLTRRREDERRLFRDGDYGA
jgi:lysozyme